MSQTQFKIDTSGLVFLPCPDPTMCDCAPVRWSDLSPFQQGAVEAALREFQAAWLREHKYISKPFRFSDLSASALQRIMAICDRMLASGLANTAEAGASAWAAQQAGLCVPEFPPLTISLAEDGLIHLSEVGE